MDDPNNPYARREPAIDPSNPFASPLAEEARGTQLNRSEEPLNPWFSMWMRPRQTIRQVIETDPRQHVLLVTALGGACDIIDPELIADESLNIILAKFIGQMLFGAAVALVGLFLMGWMVKVVARWFGGVGTALHTRAAIGWGYVPVAWLLPLMIVLNIVVLANPIDAENGDFIVAMYVIAALMMLSVGIWQLIVTSCAVAEVYQFTGFGGFGVLLLAGLIVGSVLFLLALPFIVMLAAM